MPGTLTQGHLHIAEKAATRPNIPTHHAYPNRRLWLPIKGTECQEEQRLRASGTIGQANFFRTDNLCYSTNPTAAYRHGDEEPAPIFLISLYLATKSLPSQGGSFLQQGQFLWLVFKHCLPGTDMRNDLVQTRFFLPNLHMSYSRGTQALPSCEESKCCKQGRLGGMRAVLYFLLCFCFVYSPLKM